MAMTETFSKSASYYDNVRTDVLDLLSGSGLRILEVGCGAGGTLRHAKETGLAKETFGIEVVSNVAVKAKKVVDQVRCMPIEAFFEDAQNLNEHFDAILCLDVLEHLEDPWRVVSLLEKQLKPGGRMIVSLPNVQFYKVSLRLLMKGEWEYTESGVLDSTHLRFFTRKTAIELLSGQGLIVDEVLPTMSMKPWRNKWILNKIFFGKLTDIYAYNFILSASKP